MLFNNDCSIYNSNGNSVSYNFQGTAGLYIGFDLNLSYIDSISEIQNVMIFTLKMQ